MNVLQVFCIEVLILFLLFTDVIGKETRNLGPGPYEIIFTKFIECHGPKPKNLTKIQIHSPKVGENGTLLSVVITVREIIKIDTVRMVTHSITNNLKNHLATYHPKQPCTHFVLGPLIVIAVNATNACTARPGIYTTNFDATAFSRKLFKAFLYGSYTIKYLAYSKKGNIWCFKANLLIIPDEKKAN